MKIQTIRTQAAAGAAPIRGETAGVASLRVVGPLDQNNAVLRRARDLVKKTGSSAMMASFDWAVDRNALITEK